MYLLAFLPQQLFLIQAIVERFMDRSQGPPEIGVHLIARRL